MAVPTPVTGVIVREGELTGDGRQFAAGAIQWSDTLPIPILFDRDDGDHSGATIGYIDTVWRDGTNIHGSGWLSVSDDPTTQADVNRATELLTEGAVGVSVGCDTTRGHIDMTEPSFEKVDDKTIRIPVAYDDAIITFTTARLRHLAIVDTAAVSSASLHIPTTTTGAIVASAAVSTRHYFTNPNFGLPGVDDRLRYDPDTGKWSCPPTVNGNHFYGHIAPMGICLRGRVDKCIPPPDADLNGFMRAYAPAAEGLRTGVVTLTTTEHGHSQVGVGAAEATQYYDTVGRGAADVCVGPDNYGTWFSGMIRPGTSNDDRYALAASDVSGHWEIGQRGIPQLVGLPAVNVGGYPKGYLTHQEVMEAVAAAATINPDDCDCDDEPITLDTILTFQP